MFCLYLRYRSFAYNGGTELLTVVQIFCLQWRYILFAYNELNPSMLTNKLNLMKEMKDGLLKE